MKRLIPDTPWESLNVFLEYKRSFLELKKTKLLRDSDTLLRLHILYDQ